MSGKKSYTLVKFMTAPMSLCGQISNRILRCAPSYELLVVIVVQ